MADYHVITWSGATLLTGSSFLGDWQSFSKAAVLASGLHRPAGLSIRNGLTGRRKGLGTDLVEKACAAASAPGVYLGLAE